MRALVVVNPKAGRQKPLEVAESARKHLEGAGWTVRVTPTDRPRAAVEIAAGAEPDVELVVVVGGDGTLRETIEGVGERARELTVGFIPVGNANVLAREVGIPLEPERAIECLTTSEPRAVDAGRVEGELFLAMVGVGFDAIITRGVDLLRRSALGGWIYSHRGADLIYGMCALPSFLRLLPTRFKLTVNDDVRIERCSTIFVCNTACYAKGWSMTPAARPDDGRLDYVTFESTAPWSVARSVLAAARRRETGVGRYGTGHRFRIEADRDFRWQSDGDPKPRVRSLDIELLRHAYRLLVPATPNP